MNQYLFFDHASTTKCCEGANQLVQKYARDDFGNPSSVHSFGKTAHRALKEARAFFADVFQTEPEQVIFTSGGTEANNLAVQGPALSSALSWSQKPPSHDHHSSVNVITTQLEHASVQNAVLSLSDFSKVLPIQTHFLEVDSNGAVRIDSLKKALSTEAKLSLVSIQHVNSIVGAIQDIAGLAQQAKQLNTNTIFHTDAVQSFGKIPFPEIPSRNTALIDLVSLSSHKIEGPKGIGALVVLNKKLLQGGHQKIRPLIWGGSQEQGFRAGTQNVGLVAGFHFAAKLALENLKQNQEKVSFFNKMLFESLSQELQSAKVFWNAPEHSVPNIINLSIPGYPGGALAGLLEEQNCLVSVGSACQANKSTPDPVLEAIGLPLERQSSSIRISLSHQNTSDEIKVLSNGIKTIVQRLERLNGKRPKRR